MKRTRRRLKKWVKTLILLLILISLIYTFLKVNNKHNNKESLEKEIIVEQEKKEPLKEYVKTNKKVIIYSKEYKKIGEVNENIILHITKDTKDYYKIEDLDDIYYIKDENLSNYEEEIKINDRYKKYIPFNKNIKTKNTTSFYDNNNNLVYTINKNMNIPVIIMEESRVGVIFNNRILYIKLDNNSKIIDNNNTSDTNTKGIGVLNYHFFYDDEKEEIAKCNQDICMSLSSLKKQLDYIKENNYFTPTMNEFEMYIDGKIQLPKSVVITIDDGWRAIEGLNVINDYKLNATLFVITGEYNPNDFKKEYIETHSHSDKMHSTGICPTGQGGGIQCLPEEKILEDLKSSSEKLGGSKVFCYPFYEYNDYSISVLKKAGYTMAFAGETKGSNNLTTPKTNKYKIPRFVMVNYTTINELARYLKGEYYS